MQHARAWIFMGNYSLDNVLVQAGADVNAQCASGLTALHVACRGQAVLVATLLLAAGIDGGLRDSRGCAALHYAAHTANWGLFSLLQAHASCRPKETDPQGEEDPQPAISSGSSKGRWLKCMAHKPLSSLASSVHNLRGPCHAIWHVGVQKAKALLHIRCPNMSLKRNTRVYAGANLLQYGVEGGSLDIVNLLLDELSLLQSTAGSKAPVPSDSSLEAQLAAGCCLSEPGNPGSAREHASASAAQPDNTQYDLQQTPASVAGPAPDPRPSQRASAADEACSSAAQSAAGEKGARGYACAPLHTAALRGYSDLIPSLLGGGFSASTLDAFRRTPLHYAAMKGFSFFPTSQPGAQPPAVPVPGNHSNPEPSCEQGCRPEPDASESTASPQQIGSDQAEKTQLPSHSPSSSFDSERSISSAGGPLPASDAQAALSILTPAQPAPALSCVGPGSTPLSSASPQLAGAPPPYSPALSAAAQYYRPRATVAYDLTADLLLEAGAAADSIDAWGCSALHYAAGVRTHLCFHSHAFICRFRLTWSPVMSCLDVKQAQWHTWAARARLDGVCLRVDSCLACTVTCATGSDTPICIPRLQARGKQSWWSGYWTWTWSALW